MHRVLTIIKYTTFSQRSPFLGFYLPPPPRLILRPSWPRVVVRDSRVTTSWPRIGELLSGEVWGVSLTEYWISKKKILGKLIQTSSPPISYWCCCRNHWPRLYLVFLNYYVLTEFFFFFFDKIVPFLYPPPPYRLSGCLCNEQIIWYSRLFHHSFQSTCRRTAHSFFFFWCIVEGCTKFSRQRFTHSIVFTSVKIVFEDLSRNTVFVEPKWTLRASSIHIYVCVNKLRKSNLFQFVPIGSFTSSYISVQG